MSSKPSQERGELPATEVVIDKVAEERGVDPLELPPLYDAVDPDALNTLVTPALSDADGIVRVQFTYCDHHVTVNNEGEVTVQNV